MIIIDCEQGSEEWLRARLGKIGASMVADATARTKTGWGATRANLAARLVVERLTGNLTETFTSPAMLHGIATEPDARTAYSFVNDVEVATVGLIIHPTIDNAVASPDGLVGDDGLVEIKCPQPAKHLSTITGAAIDGSYYKQMQWQMACSGRQWVDFVSYSPAFPAEMRLHVRRVTRDTDLIATLESEVAAFLAEIDATIADLKAKYQEAA